MNSYITVLKKYAVFSGRAGRREYWMFSLVSLIITIALTVADELLHTPNTDPDDFFGGLGLLTALYSLATLLPCLAVSWRRMHDIGRSGLLNLINLLPVIGWIIFIAFAALEGDRGPNQYGPDPSGSRRRDGPDRGDADGHTGAGINQVFFPPRV